MTITLDLVRAALALPDFDPIAAQLRMAPARRGMYAPEGSNPRQAGVLALLYPEDNGLHVVLTRRTDTLRGHRGQISFPGGQRDPEDDSFTATALRETYEELGIQVPEAGVIGQLSPLYIPPSHFEVYPSVAALSARPVFKPNPHEVAEVLTFSLDDLLDAKYKAWENRDFQGAIIEVPFYAVHGHKVWGATAAMLSELEARLAQAVGE